MTKFMSGRPLPVPSRAVRLAEIEERLDSGTESLLIPERALAIARAALASAQRDRYQLERQVEQLTAELRRLGAGSAAGELTRSSPAPSLEPLPASAATS